MPTLYRRIISFMLCCFLGISTVSGLILPVKAENIITESTLEVSTQEETETEIPSGESNDQNTGIATVQEVPTESTTAETMEVQNEEETTVETTEETVTETEEIIEETTSETVEETIEETLTKQEPEMIPSQQIPTVSGSVSVESKPESETVTLGSLQSSAPVIGGNGQVGVYLYRNENVSIPTTATVTIEQMDSEDYRIMAEALMEEKGYTDMNYTEFWKISLRDGDVPLELPADVQMEVYYLELDQFVARQETETVHMVKISGDDIALLDYSVLETAESDTCAEAIRCVGFSGNCTQIYGLVKTASTVSKPEAGTAEAETEGCKVSASYDEKAGFPEGMKLAASCVKPGSDAYKEFLAQAKDAETDASLVYADFYDISFLLEEEEREPAEGAEVTVTLNFDNGIVMGQEQLLHVVHFLADGSYELLEPQIVEQDTNEAGDIVIKELCFEQSSFSVIGVIIFDKGVVTVINVKGEFFSGAPSKTLTKKWIDWEGNDETEEHAGDTVTVVLEEVVEADDGTKTYYEVQRKVLSASTDWQCTFTDLDVTKTYRMVEESVTSGDAEVKDIYRSELDSGIIHKENWTMTDTLKEGGYYLIEDASRTNTQVLRASSTVETNATLGKITPMRYTGSSIKASNYSLLQNKTPYAMFMSTLTEEGTWLLQNKGNKYYLTLSKYEDGTYHWNNTEKIYQGSYLTIENGKICATTEDGYTGWLQYPQSSSAGGSGSYDSADESPYLHFCEYIYEVQQSTATLTNRRNQTPEELAFSVNAEVNKSIDYLGDGAANPDTDADTTSVEDVLQDLYRLYLDFRPKTDATGLDLVLVLDVSSSMDTQDVLVNGEKISRTEALYMALDEFIPEFLNDPGNRNRLAITAFEHEAIFLQDWTQDPDTALAAVRTDGLMSGSGTNYEAGLMRAHEALANRGASTNKKAMIFFSDGEPNCYVEGNDTEEPGNVTIALGDGIVVTPGSGLTGYFTLGLSVSTAEWKEQTKDAITSFRLHNSDTVIGTVAFRTKLSDYLTSLATSDEYIIGIQDGGPAELIDAMKLITDFAPSGIAITDVLSENVELYDEDPDYRATVKEPDGTVTVLYENGALTAAGQNVLDANKPIVYDPQARTVTMTFHSAYLPQDSYTYTLSFNVRPSQKAYNRFADSSGVYSDVGQVNTDYSGNQTSSGKNGYFSNDDESRVVWTFQNVEHPQYYPRPVIQVRDGSLTLQKVDLETGQVLLSGSRFVLYRAADANDRTYVAIEGLTGNYVKVAEAVTGDDGKLTFDHLRLAVFDEGYHYYLVETEAPEGYSRVTSPIGLTLYQDKVVLDSDLDGMVAALQDGVGLSVKNETAVPLKLTKVAAEDTAKPLSGAEFEIYRLICKDSSHDHSGILDPEAADKTCWECYGIQTSDEDGKLSFLLPVNSTYRLLETKAPGGYVLPRGQWEITVDADGNISPTAIADDKGNQPPAFMTNGEDGYKITNMKPREIPTTGGPGIGNYHLVGMLLMAAGMVVSILGFRRRKNFC